jgi:hypothetical protein
LTRSRLWHPLVATLLAMPLVVLASPSVQGASTCNLAGTGLTEHFWVNGAGDWGDTRHWQDGVVPGTGTGNNDYVCIPEGAEVTIDDPISRVDLTAFDLGRGASLTLTDGTSLFVWGDQDTQESRIRLGATVDVRNATLGGGGLIHVIGTVRMSRAEGGTPTRLSSHADLDADTGADGRMLVGDGGEVVLAGDGDVGLSWGYTVDVRGVALITDKASLLAEHGTTFELRPHLSGDGGAGQLLIDNDKGYFEGATRGAEPLSTFVNEGRIVKQGGQGSSIIAASYRSEGEGDDAGQVIVKTGALVMPDDTWALAKVAAGLVYGAGSCEGDVRACDSDTSVDEPQFATLQVPEEDSNGAKVVVTPVEDDSVKALGEPIKAHALGLHATRQDPAVIELRYDSTLLTAAGRPSDPAALQVSHKGRNDNGYSPLPDCSTAGLIPGDAIACVDRRTEGSRVVDDGDVIMVVRTTQTSRWIVP